MYKIAILSLGMFLLGLKFVPEKITVYIIGDSTAANKSPKAFPETGWGTELGPLFNDKVKVDNRAMNGRSTKSFINEKRWESVLSTLKEGDYVLIEFGHNDEKVDKPTVGTSLNEFKSNLVKFVRETREKKAFPVLMTPIVRRNFKSGVLTDTHGAYPDVVRKLADSLRVPFVDMLKKTEKMVGSLGDLPSKKLYLHVDSGHVNYPSGKKDDTHLSPDGAKAYANLAAEGMKENKLGIAKFLLKK